MEWSTRQAGRLDEMSGGTLSLRIEIHPDGDIILSIDLDGMSVIDEAGNQARVEFCSISGGGGRSPHTREALIALFKAMILDNRKDPSGVPQFPVHLAQLMEKEP